MKTGDLVRVAGWSQKKKDYPTKKESGMIVRS